MYIYNIIKNETVLTIGLNFKLNSSANIKTNSYFYFCPITYVIDSSAND